MTQRPSFTEILKELREIEMQQSGLPGPSNVNASFTNSTINGPSIQAQTVYVGRSKNDEEPSLGVVDDNRNKLVIRQEKSKPRSDVLKLELRSRLTG